MTTLTCEYNNQICNIKDYVNNMKGKITCRFCKQRLIAKRGTFLTHHFSHSSNNSCDSWHEHKTEWHLNWQSIVKTNNIEVIMNRVGVKHIADIYNPEDNLVIEIQNSYMSAQEVEAREKFYDKMIWIINLCYGDENNDSNIQTTKNKSTSLCIVGNNFVILKTVKKYFTNMKNDVYLDTSFGLLKLVKCLPHNQYFCERVNIDLFLSTQFKDLLNNNLSDIVQKIEKYHNKDTPATIGEFDVNYEYDNGAIKIDGDDIEELQASGEDFFVDIGFNPYGSNITYGLCSTCESVIDVVDETVERGMCKQCGEYKICLRCGDEVTSCTMDTNCKKNLCKECDIECFDQTFLDVPYADKDEAKKYGVRFDGDSKKWYAYNDNKDIKIILGKWKECQTYKLNEQCEEHKYCLRCGDEETSCIMDTNRKENLCKGCDIECFGQTFLDVPYADKDEAKNYGARFDGKSKKWYVYNDNENIKIILEKWKECQKYKWKEHWAERLSFGSVLVR